MCVFINNAMLIHKVVALKQYLERIDVVKLVECIYEFI